MASSHTEGVVQAECLLSPKATPSAGGALNATSSISRQTSIYSLTLDELQNVLGEPTKSFGSMNMDEFLKNIWTVEESQAMAAAMGGGGNTDELHLPYEHGMQRQASISLPRTLSHKTVDDVWKGITRDSHDMGLDPMFAAAAGTNERQATFGEMTLEDFLLKAGVVKKDDRGLAASNIPLEANFDRGFGAASSSRSAEQSLHVQAPFGLKGAEVDMAGGGNAIPLLPLSGSNIPASQGGLEPMQIETMNNASPAMQQSKWLPNNAFKTELVYAHSPHHMLPQHHAGEASTGNGVCGNGAMIGGLGGTLGPDSGVGFAGGVAIPSCNSPASLALKTGSPQSPLLDGMGPPYNSMGMGPPYDSMGMHSPLPYGALEGGIGRGRKRDFEGSFEKVVERRQKRMIKNRESAARSRARKQAYTVELEAEVLHLKEENLRLRLHEEEMAECRRQQLIDVVASFRSQFAPKACKLRRTHTGPW